MSLYKRIEDDMKAALKEGDSRKLSVLRMLVSAIKVFEIDEKVKEAQDADVIQIVQRHIKQHKESIAQFEKGKRADLVEKETNELKVLEAYVPKQLSEAELTAIVKEGIIQSGAKTPADVGKVMKIVMEKVKGKAEGKVVNQIAMKLLGSS